jgi:hydroxymethylbilane synthase
MPHSDDALRAGDVIAAAARTLARMRTYVKTAVPHNERAAAIRALLQISLEELATMNAVQAEHRVEEVVVGLREASTSSAALRQAQDDNAALRHTQDDNAQQNDPNVVVCASRGSALAMTQTRTIAAKLAQAGIATTILNITTTGDRIQDRSLVSIGAESLFVKELELALRDGRAHYAVHSCKDLPSTLPADMRIAAISRREDARDVFCSEHYASFEELPSGARVGTSSLRRRAQLAAMRSDLHYADVRGNIDTRLRKLREGQYDAIVLASAGLRRLGVGATYTIPFEVGQMVPAVAQGALAVETLESANVLAQRLREAVNDEETERAVLCERAALRTLQGGCQAPIGIHARYENGELAVDAVIASLDGSTVLRESARGPAPTTDSAEALGAGLAQRMLARGAQSILAASPRPAPLPLAGKLVLLPRPGERAGRIAAALRADGAEVVEMQALGERVPDLIVLPSSGSVNAAVGYLQNIHRYERRPAVATMGPESSAAAHAAGFTPDVVAPESQVEALVGAVRAHLISKEDGR